MGSIIDFRKAREEDVPGIWIILQQAIERRRLEGSTQWQDGYPNVESIRRDLEHDWAYVLTVDGSLAGYAAVMINQEPAYEHIRGKWLSDGDFVVFHRVALSNAFAGQKLGYRLIEQIESMARAWGIKSVRADTNFDNLAMLSIFKRLGYRYCGDVQLRGGKRKAFEKILS